MKLIRVSSFSLSLYVYTYLFIITEKKIRLGGSDQACEVRVRLTNSHYVAYITYAPYVRFE